MLAQLKNAARSAPAQTVGAPLVRMALRGRSDASIESRWWSRHLVRFPIRPPEASTQVPGAGALAFPTSAAPHLYWAGASAFEPDVVPVFVELCRGAGSVVDVGANFGFYTAVAGLVAPRARIHAIEPNPLTFDVLRRTVALNGVDAVLHRLALSDEAGSVALSLAGGLSSIVADRAAHREHVEVETARFDDLFPDGAGLVKLDVEGAELAALRGMPRTLSAARPPIVAEIGPASFDDVARYLDGFEYEILGLPSLTPARGPSSGENYLLQPRG